MCLHRGIVTLMMAFCGWMASTSVGFADFIGDTDGNTVTAFAPSHFTNMPADWLVDGSGMTPKNPVTKASTEDTAPGNMWMSADSPAPGDMWVKFTFTKPTSLSEMVIWNFNQNAGVDYPNLWHAGLKDVTITYSTGTDESGIGKTLGLGSYQLASATGSATQPYTSDLTFSASNVKAIKIVYTSNWWQSGDYAGYQDNFGLSEVRFVAGVPEPGSIFLLATSLPGLLCYAWRKRR
jgi:hypothetical protein